MNNQKLLSKKCIAVISVVLLLVCLATLIIPTPGHDVNYWISRLYLFGEEIRTNGILAFPFSIYEECYSKYGYGAPLFYGDALLLLPAALVAVGLPVNIVYGFTLAMFLAIRFLLAYVSVKIAFPDSVSAEKGINQYGFLFALFYSVFPYLLDNAFVRAAVGEVIASAFIPIVLACIYRIIHGENVPKGICLYLAVGLFGVVCSHVVTTVLLAVVIVIYVLTQFGRLWREKRRLGMLLGAAGLAVCLSAFWLFPFLEQFLLSPPGYSGTTPGNYTMSLKDWFVSTELEDAIRLYLLDDYNTIFEWKPSGFIYPLLLGVVLWVRFRKEIGKRPVKYLAGAWLIVLAISCKPLIDLLQKPLSFVQFPWRLLWLVGLLTAAFLTCALAKIRRRGWTIAALIVCLVCGGITSGVSWMRHVRFYEPLTNYREMGVDTLYLPEGAWWQLASERGEVVDCTDFRVQYTWQRSGDEILIDYANNTAEATFQLPLHYYLGYTAYDTINESYMEVSKSEIGLVNVTVKDNGSGSIVVAYTGTGIQKIAKGLSVLAWLAVGGYAVFVKWKKRGPGRISENEERRKEENL